MLTKDQINQLGGTVYGQGGDGLGSIGQIYLDDQTGQPEWVTVKTGLFGSKESFVPLAQAETQVDGLSVPYAKDMVKGAPAMDADGHLSEQDEDDLYRYCGLGDGTTGGTGYAAGTVEDSHAGRADLTGRAGVVGPDTSGPTTDDAMTRSEEHLVAGTQRAETGRARLRKHVVTETQQVRVPVSHEEVTLEREPITDANRAAAYSGGDITEQVHDVTLMAEKPVLGVETEAVERVRLGTETVTGTETVSGEVRKEQIEMDDSTGTAKNNKRSKR